MANGDENKKNLDEQKKFNKAKETDIKLTKETKVELLSQREALNEILKLQKSGTEYKRETVGLSRDLAKLTAEELSFKQKSNKFIRSEKELTAALLKNENVRNELKEKMKNASGDEAKNLKAQLNTTKSNESEIRKQVKLRDSINKKIGITDNLLRGIEDIPFLNKFIDGEAAIAAAELAIIKAGDSDEASTLAKVAAVENLKQQLKDAAEDAKDLASGFLIKQGVSLFGQMFRALVELSSKSTEFQKSMALTNEEASTMNYRLQNIAMGSRNTAISMNDARDAFANINEQLGIATKSIRNDIVEEMAILAKTTGLSAEAQGNFAKDAILSGKNAHEITKAARATVEAQVKQGKLGLNVNKILDEAGQITGVMAANFGFSIERMAKALAISKQLGISLAQTEGIQSNILDFSSSIENELAAELFTNKQLNLEKARLYALTNDYTNLQKEITKQFPSLIEFEKMNYFAKERTAAALGLEVNAMSDIIRGNKTNADLAKEAEDAGETALQKEYEKLSIADNLAAAQERLVTSLTMMIEPLMPILDAFSFLLQSSFAIKTAMVAFAAVKLGGLIMGLKAIAVTLGMSAKSALTTAISVTLGTAALIIIPAILAANAQVKNAPNPASKNDLSPMDVAQIQRGEVKAHSGESLIRTNTLEALLNKTGGNKEQNMQPVVLSVNYSGFDAVKAPSHYNSNIR